MGTQLNWHILWFDGATDHNSFFTSRINPLVIKALKAVEAPNGEADVDIIQAEKEDIAKMLSVPYKWVCSVGDGHLLFFIGSTLHHVQVLT